MQPGVFGFPPGRILKSQSFYSSDYFGVPLGVHLVWITGVAGGGGGGRTIAQPTYTISDTWTGGGGAGEEAHRIPVAVINGILIPISIGLGGGYDAAGGNTSFGDFIVLAGGEAGGSFLPGNGSFTGARVAGGKRNGQPSVAHGRGGDSMWGKGGVLTGSAPLAANTNGVNATGYGAGGSGAYASSIPYPATVTGGSGTPGFLKVEWFEDF